MNDPTNGWITAVAAGLINCHSCGLLHKATQAHVHCHRCGASLHARKPDSLSRTWAYLLAACILYIPANVLPIMTTTSLGSIQSNTILSGVNYLLITGSWLLALIIFIASVFVPALKLIILSYLAVSVQLHSSWHPKQRAWLYRLAEIMGRWSMVDIYVVTLMVALVKIHGLADIDAGSGAVAFGAVVVLTMLAAMSFDPRLIWDNAENSNE